jgi:hypothetical protein
MQKNDGVATDVDGKLQVIITQDGKITDAEFWGLWEEFKQNVRVLFITDCCHSAGVAETKLRDPITISLIHLCACDNDQESRGNAVDGGRFTRALLWTFRQSPKDYHQWIEETKKRVADPRQIADMKPYGQGKAMFAGQRPLADNPFEILF